MPTSVQPQGLPNLAGLSITYTATGLEGTSFLVPIGSTMPSNAYRVLHDSAGVSNVSIVDIPNSPGDRTTTYFRVVTADVLTAGDTLVFLLVSL